ncbi:MAG: peptidyl-prolyl cis-trans isomerase [Gammaproteobacteria bacterium]|nr:peptidyl-prolyl cis-trans isomerase [Gammaproteobacteria bacterium]
MGILVNGIEVDPSGWPTPEFAAVHELLRQRAFKVGLLDGNTDREGSMEAVETLLQREVEAPEPSEEECRRWYDGHKQEYRSGELVHARHILFQVAPGVPVQKVRKLARGMLMELQARPEKFAERARTKSNCPSGANGGELGQLQRGSTVPEFEQAVFGGNTIGVLPDLVRSRHGFHIVAVDRRIPGEQLPYEAVAGKVADKLRSAAEERALRQYISMLAGGAALEGVDLNAATSPLVQ